MKLKRKDYNCRYPDISNVASAQDCTGLMPRPPLDDDEYRAYQELSGMEIPEIDQPPPSVH